MKGFFNKLLKIDLMSETFTYEEIPDSTLVKTLGGKGLGAHLLLKENPQGVDSLSPDNIFVITTGPVTGTKTWGQSRFGVYSKSPATCGFGESYCGGKLAQNIKGCGVDAIIVYGKAKILNYLHITPDKVLFKECSEIKGWETHKAEEYILNNSPEKSGAMVIGPAGENLVRFACIKSERYRSLGRGGLGAVLGSKNIKGISFKGEIKCTIANEELLKQVVKELAEKYKNSPVTKLYKELGTPLQVKATNAQKCFPTRYWQSGYFPEWEKISADYMQNNFKVKAVGCPTCFLKCTKNSTVTKGRHRGLQIEGPEYETIYALGGLNELNSLEEVTWLNDVCDRLGIDTMSAGNISAFAIEAFKAGKIDFEIDYNQPNKMEELFRMITYGKGIGKIFAKGIKEASQELGMEDVAIHVKGLEPAGFEPRVLKGMGLSYATSARGACHLRGTFYKAELSGQVDKDKIPGKAQWHVDYEDRSAIFDCLILCRFFRDFILWDELLLIIEATTGMKLKKEELEAFANNVTNMTRKYNHKEGIDTSFDTLPKPFFQPNKQGAKITKSELNTMINEYNKIRVGLK